jgi:hypothetical protein
VEDEESHGFEWVRVLTGVREKRMGYLSQKVYIWGI